MASLASHPGAFELKSLRRPRRRDETVDRLYLRATDDGWSVRNSSGEILFGGLGLSGRRRCLEFAREVGALVVFA